MLLKIWRKNPKIHLPPFTFSLQISAICEKSDNYHFTYHLICWYAQKRKIITFSPWFSKISEIKNKKPSSLFRAIATSVTTKSVEKALTSIIWVNIQVQLHKEVLVCSLKELSMWTDAKYFVCTSWTLMVCVNLYLWWCPER